MSSKAVILGSNFYIGLSIIRALGKCGIYTVAMDYSKLNTYASKSKYLNEQIIVPHYKHNKEELLSFLIEYGQKQEEKPVMYPTVDPYVEFIDSYLYELKDYYHINMTQKGLLRETMDKQSLHLLASKLQY